MAHDETSAAIRTKRKVIVSINAAWNILNFRANLVKALAEQGLEVVALTPDDAHAASLAGIGCRHVALAMNNKGTNPLQDGGLFLRYVAILRRERPDAFLGWTIKPNVYGSLAAHLLNIPVINNVSGLGTAFTRDSWLTRIAEQLYRVALRRSACVFFQNADDLDLFESRHLVRSGQTALLPGSGIALDHFTPTHCEAQEGPVFLLIARLLWDKGVAEYVAAARQVRAVLPGARFHVLGFLDANNRTAITRAQVEDWTREGVITYLGAADDVRPHISAADCVVLPSYREGVPRSLLEAAAMARPQIATDVPGCRDAVEDGVTGLLCRARDSEDLAQKMLIFAAMTPQARAAMGAAGRRRMEQMFDERIVIDRYLNLLKSVLPPLPA